MRSPPTRFIACALLQVPPNSSARAYSVSIQYGSVSTRVPSMSHSTAAGSSVIRVVAQVGRQPPLGLGQRPALALGVVAHLVATEAADDEVLRVGVGEVPARDRRAGPHGHALSELDARR